MKNHFIRLMALLMALIICFGMTAQDNPENGMRNEALSVFAENNYEKALPLYRELLNTFPKEPEYLFGAGVCLVKLNQDLEEAVGILRSVSLVNYDPLSWYYLGRALHLSYSFEEAIKAYSKYLLAGKSADIAFYQVERLIEMARNGIELTGTGKSLHVLSKQTIPGEQMPIAATINGNGKLLRKPLEFCTRTDLKEGYRPWMFLPLFTEINDYIYLTGYEKRKRNEKQLFRIRNLNHESWGAPELLDFTVNTSFDEEFPYFDPKSSTLYFSSKGHSSMGGYDIFRSVYDRNTKTWSKPENLGFPINSPFDDLLFITDEFNRNASFVSNRGSGPGQAEVYRIKLDREVPVIRFANVDEIRDASRLAVEEARPVPIPVQEPVKTVTADYDKVLTEALIMQLKADSLSRIARDKRLQAKDNPDEEMKKQLVTEIIQTDKAAKLMQREADQKFGMARSLKTDEAPFTNDADSAIELAGEINDIKIFQYKPGTVKSVDAPAVITDEFAILDASPYNDSNPIPRGISVHPGLIYRIQLGVFSKPKPNEAFGGISPVAFEQVNGSNILKYYAGLFTRITTVTQALEKVRMKGFPDAFIVAFLDGKMISTEKAREIEFEKFKL